VKFLTSFLLLLVFIIVISAGFFGVFPSTETFKGSQGNLLPGSLAVLETIELGGLEQAILIRGKDLKNPVLLWLHGGPGSAQMPLAHELDAELEEEFIVVHWDQRGAGKSNHGGFWEETMTFEQFLEDSLQLINYLRRRFSQEKIFLLGHSWGSQLGMELVNAYPELFQAYIGVSQLVDSREGVEIAYEWLIAKLEEKGDQKYRERLDEIGSPPYNHNQYRIFASMVSSYGGNFDRSMSSLVLIALRAQEYNVLDYYRWIQGANRGGKPLHREGEMTVVNFREEIPSVEVPVFFFAGALDKNTPLELVEEYYGILKAPHKEIIFFENSAHTPFLAEPERFNREIIKIKEKTGF